MNSEAKKLIRSVCRTKPALDRELETTVALYVDYAIRNRIGAITLYHPFCEGPSKGNRRRSYDLTLQQLHRAERAGDHVPQLIFVDPVTGEPRA